MDYFVKHYSLMVGPWATLWATSRIKFQVLSVEHKPLPLSLDLLPSTPPFSLPHCAPTMWISLHFPEYTVSFLTTVPLHMCFLWTRIPFSLCSWGKLIHLSKASSEITSFTKFSSTALLPHVIIYPLHGIVCTSFYEYIYYCDFLLY